MVNGNKETLDITDEECLKFGFKHGDRIVTPRGNEGTIMGVGFSCDCVLCLLNGTAGKKALHAAMDKDNGKVGQCSLGNLRDLGYVLKSEAEQAEKEPEPVINQEVNIGDDTKFKVDISDEACQKLSGFKHGDLITNLEKNREMGIWFEGIVIGVAPVNPGKKFGKKVLWVKPVKPKNENFVVCISNDDDLKGFTLVPKDK